MIKKFILGSVAMVFLALVVILFLISTNSQVGDKPSHKDMSTCSDYARTVIEKEGIDLIHECIEEQIEIEGEQFYKIEIQSGPGGDCPSGCIYGIQQYIIHENKDGIHIIPHYSDEKKLRSKLFDFIRSNKESFSNETLDLIYLGDDFRGDESIKVRIGKIGFRYGWVFESEKYFGKDKILFFAENDTFFDWEISDKR